ncbi:MAG TPA: Tad domain-containing protein [Gaiellaceae bacterium]|nr:Tad domain-containing protein [Gaiellaceae bacterium]
MGEAGPETAHDCGGVEEHEARRARSERAMGRSFERGQVVVVFAFLLPVLMAVGAIVISLGNWFVHTQHLQAKVDAAAFAGGGVWGFPCGPDIDENIEQTSREYVGGHTAADGTVVTSDYNPQVGGVEADKVFVALNQSQWWDDAFADADFTDPAGSVCEAKILDVKATEADSWPLWRWLPLFPNLKRKARVEIQEVDGISGLLPIAVRLPQPLSAAAVFYEETTGTILDAKYFREDNGIFGLPTGLGGWTTLPDPAEPGGSWASFDVAARTGVAIAVSFRAACGTPGATAPCFSISGFPTVNELCTQSGGQFTQCFYATGTGASQNVRAGLHFIRGYPAGDVGTGRPELRSAWLENVSCPSNGYFNSTRSSCQAKLTVKVDIGSLDENPPPDPPDDNVQTRSSEHVEVRYCLVRTGQTGATVCESQFGVAQDLECSGGPGEVECSTVGATHPQITPNSIENAFAIQVRLRRTSVDGFPDCTNDPDSEYHNLCRFFFTGSGYAGDSVPPSGAQVLAAPVQRSFMGNLEVSSPVEWLRLTADPDCDLDPGAGSSIYIDGPAASQAFGAPRCFYVDMGLKAGLARDQDEPPITFNLGSSSSQRAYVDCDPNIQPDPRQEIVQGCGIFYSANRFNTSPLCPGVNGFWSTPKLEPFDDWPAFRCVLTQTGNSAQVIQGFNERIFGRASNPVCPGDDMTQYVKGRNYWHRDNNDYDEYTFAWDGDGDPSQAKGNTLRDDDPRLFTLFFTTYDSFTSTGNETYPIVGFGNFYITGWGESRNGAMLVEDPCSDGNDGDLLNGNGNEPPPDIDLSINTRWAWGHFVHNVAPAPFTSGGSGELCRPQASFQPCVAVLVE